MAFAFVKHYLFVPYRIFSRLQSLANFIAYIADSIISKSSRNQPATVSISSSGNQWQRPIKVQLYNIETTFHDLQLHFKRRFFPSSNCATGNSAALAPSPETWPAASAAASRHRPPDAEFFF